MNLADAFPSRFLKSADLKDDDLAVVIAKVTIEEIGNEPKLILAFQGDTKEMICNKTNANRIAYLYGEETDDWTGKEVVLTSEFVEFQGKTVKGLRIKPPAKKAAAGPKHVVRDRGGYKTSELRNKAEPDDPFGDDLGDFGR